jgi:putative lipoprotein
MRALASLVLPAALLLSACAASPTTQTEIVGPVWVAESIGGAGVVSGPDVTLKLDAEGRAGGKAGCNSYGSSYQRDSNTLKFEQAFSTKMFCSPDAVMAQEQAYLDLLARVISYQTPNGKLELLTSDGKKIVFH